MILLRANLIRLYHFSKPLLSSIPSTAELQTLLQKSLVQEIKRMNSQALKPYDFNSHLSEELVLSKQITADIANRDIHVSVINPRTLQHQTATIRVSQDLKKMKFDAQKFGLPLREYADSLQHFSEFRGVPTFEQLQDYQFDERTLMLFNLPQNTSQQDIQVTLKDKNVKIELKYCVLGLPAFAKVQFESEQALNKVLDRIKERQINFGERTVFMKTKEDAQKLKLGNRRLLVNIEESDKLEDIIVQLSRHGRVLHIDWPIQVSMNPSVEEIKQFYKNSSELIKINQIHADGTIQSEYYPSKGKLNHFEEEKILNVIEQSQNLEDMYENRTRFAKNINVKVEEIGQLSIKDRGYFVVTYSTFEQCQNLYFSHSIKTKMELVGDRLQFEYDPLFRKELLRQIDNEYLLGKKIRLDEKKADDNNYDSIYQAKIHQRQGQKFEKQSHRNPTVNPYHLLKKILIRKSVEQLTSQIPRTNVNQAVNPYIEWEKYLKEMKEEKSIINSQTFDELAQIELFGRVLPKDENIQSLKIQSTKKQVERQRQLFIENGLISDVRSYNFKQKFYLRQRERNNRLANEALGITIGGQAQIPAEQEVPVQEEPVVQGDENIGKAGFSTVRPAQLYRKRNAEESAHYYYRYFNFVRKTIYEFMGVFDDKSIEQSINNTVTIINPRTLKFIDGTDFLRESEVTKALQFRRDLAQAQKDYDSFVLNYEYVKSKGVSAQNICTNSQQIIQTSFDNLNSVGVVEEAIKVEGQLDALIEKAKILNIESAQFGQEYKIEETKGDKYLVKLIKLQHLVPLDKIAQIEDFIMQNTVDITEDQAKVFQKHHKQIQKTGVIPNEVADIFGVAHGKTINELLIQTGTHHNITSKDLQMCQRYKNLSKDQVTKDINEQIKLENSRKLKKKMSSKDFVKDPSQIYVKDREGYFKVSRYRQI